MIDENRRTSDSSGSTTLASIERLTDIGSDTVITKVTESDVPEASSRMRQLDAGSEDCTLDSSEHGATLLADSLVAATNALSDASSETTSDAASATAFDSPPADAAALPTMQSLATKDTAATAADTILSTPTSKVTASTGTIKRSFARQKQVKELLNTERVYIQSLQILNATYIEGMMADLETPLYFRKFRRVIDKLIFTHKNFLETVIAVYVSWGASASCALQEIQAIASPEFDNFQVPFNEQPYLEKIFRLISEEAVDVPSYCHYCSLFNRVLEFSKDKNVEKYKRLSIQIMNDCVVERVENESPDYMTEQKLDTRFISLVQMPTARITRYALIVRSLLDKVRLDDPNSEILRKGQLSIDNLTEKCLTINAYIGVAQEKQNKMALFNQLSEGTVEKKIGHVFLENLGAVEFVGGYGAVWLENNHVIYDCMAVFLFDTHILLFRMHHLRQPEIRFIIPCASILNSFQREEIEVTRLFTRYPYHIKLRFEESFKQYELVLIFPSEYEQNMWATKLKKRAKKWRAKIPESEFGYSTFVENLPHYLSHKLPFNLTSYLPSSLDYYKENGGKYVEEMEETHIFVVRHFVTRINGCDQNEIIRAAEEIRHLSAVLVHVPRDQRTSLEKILGSLWSKELPLYHLEGGIISRKVSTINFRNVISEETRSLFSLFSGTTSFDEQQSESAFSLCRSHKFRQSFSNVRDIILPAPALQAETAREFSAGRSRAMRSKKQVERSWGRLRSLFNSGSASGTQSSRN
ncbi:DEKNAAC101978 [Brettanomyces naardenensis]|uniref:DEKNAAC101978 n=1 Tax=Brettanomyces naardenensis TaxID=13370 RepID=A0A448YJH4_BRENA|nr:DEKNAAC101978 [Brettanomyces naardenensis]